jgi:hypothetical protein
LSSSSRSVVVGISKSRFGAVNQYLLAAVKEAAFGVGVFVFREEPDADRDLRAIEVLDGDGSAEFEGVCHTFFLGAFRFGFNGRGSAALSANGVRVGKTRGAWRGGGFCLAA